MRKFPHFAAHLLRAFAAIFLSAIFAIAQEAAPDRPPVKRVVVYDTGVAFIEHEAKVSGDKELLLDLPDRDVNDLLKSMVAKDSSSGRVSWAALPTSSTKTAPVLLANREKLSDLVNAFRGMRIRIGAAAPVEGELLLVENRADEKTKETIPQATLLTAAGIVRVDIKNGDSIQLIDDAQRRAVARSAELLDSTRDLNSTRVLLKCEGEGERQVRIGYVAASPVWKASYRLVLREDGKSLLQAWALVENSTQSDWNEIECTLVSGRSLGFQTDLRTPLTIKRPYRAPQRYAALAPQAHKPAEAEKLESQAASKVAAESWSDDPTSSLDFDAGVRQSMGMGMGGMGGMGDTTVPLTEMNAMLNARLSRWRDESSRAGATAPPSAQAGYLDSASRVGESIRYQLKGRVSIAKGQTALLHLLDAELAGQEIAAFNPSVDPLHPLHAIQLENSSGGALAAGPVSIFSGTAYRGDSLVEHWPAGAKRLISYAVDTEATVRWDTEETPLEYLGVLVTDRDELVFVAKETFQGAYVVENRGEKAKTVWIEHPRFKDWALIAPEKVAETAADRYRLEVKVEPQKQLKTPVTVTRYRLLWPDAVEARLSEKQINATAAFSESVRQALALNRQKETDTERDIARSREIKRLMQGVEHDQERLRNSIRSLEKYPDQAKLYLDRLAASEKSLETLEKELKELAIEEDEDEVDIAPRVEKEYEKNWKAILEKIKAENPSDKLPYKPTEKEIDAWRNRQRPTGMGGMGGMGMGGMGGGFF